MQSLQGKVALVTGAGRGIGKAISMTLAQMGVSVAMLARTESEVKETADEICKLHGEALPLIADVNKPATDSAMRGDYCSEMGQLDQID
jgi:3-oxoacyl-[acyl-carrier protein] reductase